jgi:hypothetical protein
MFNFCSATFTQKLKIPFLDGMRFPGRSGSQSPSKGG